MLINVPSYWCEFDVLLYTEMVMCKYLMYFSRRWPTT